MCGYTAVPEDGRTSLMISVLYKSFTHLFTYLVPYLFTYLLSIRGDQTWQITTHLSTAKG